MGWAQTRTASEVFQADLVVYVCMHELNDASKDMRSHAPFTGNGSRSEGVEGGQEYVGQGSFNGINKQFSCRIASGSFRIQGKQQMSQPVVCNHLPRHDFELSFRETFACR